MLSSPILEAQDLIASGATAHRIFLTLRRTALHWFRAQTAVLLQHRITTVVLFSAKRSPGAKHAAKLVSHSVQTFSRLLLGHLQLVVTAAVTVR